MRVYRRLMIGSPRPSMRSRPAASAPTRWPLSMSRYGTWRRPRERSALSAAWWRARSYSSLQHTCGMAESAAGRDDRTLRAGGRTRRFHRVEAESRQARRRRRCERLAKVRERGRPEDDDHGGREPVVDGGHAIARTRRLEPYNLYWIEEPSKRPIWTASFASVNRRPSRVPAGKASIVPRPFTNASAAAPSTFCSRMSRALAALQCHRRLPSRGRGNLPVCPACIAGTECDGLRGSNSVFVEYVPADGAHPGASGHTPGRIRHSVRCAGTRYRIQSGSPRSVHSAERRRHPARRPIRLSTLGTNPPQRGSHG